MSQYYGVHVVLQLPLSLTLIALTLLIAELNVATFYLALYVFSFSHMLLGKGMIPFLTRREVTKIKCLPVNLKLILLPGTLAFTLLEAFRLLMKQLAGLLVVAASENKNKSSPKVQNSCARANFRQQYTRVVILVSKANKYVARAFMPLLAVNCPSNALLTITLLTSQAGRLDLVVQLLTIMVLFEQFLCIFLVHSLLANLNDRLKSIAKKFIPLMYSQKGKGNRKTRLLNYLFLSKFHTSKAYGFTYYKFGRISSFNFVKASWLLK